MQTTAYPKILAFVEGYMERLFVNNNVKYIDVIPIDNGRTWSIAALANQIASKFYVRNANPDLIIVWVDKEDRDSSASDLKAAILDALSQRGANLNRVKVLVPDRMTENIILSDELLIREHFGNPEYIYDYDGHNGKAILSSMYAEEGISYKETFHGVKMLKSLRLRRCADPSGQIAVFLDGVNLDCWWLE